MVMTYKAIPGPKVISITNGDQSSATNAFAAIINAEAQDGWVYHSMETITVQEKVGCALQPQLVNTSIYMLIFCHE
jgi:hypothetical protein